MGDDRKARLAALAAKAGRTKVAPTDAPTTTKEGEGEDSSSMVPMDTENNNNNNNINNEKRTVSFRNYAPKDETLEEQSKTTTSSSAFDEESPPKRFKSINGRNNEAATTTTTAAQSSALEDALKEAQQEVFSTSISSSKVHHQHQHQPQTNGKQHDTNDIAAMAPKKINWDLKRDIQEKLAKLEKRTQKAIVQLLKERLEKEATEQVDDDDDNDNDSDAASDLD